MQTVHLVTTAEALAILRRSSPSTVTRLVQAGKLSPAQKLPGLRGAYLFDKADVERLAAKRSAA